MSWHEIQTKLGATVCGDHYTPRTMRRDAGRRVCRASGAPGAMIERASRAIEVGRQFGDGSRWHWREAREGGGFGEGAQSKMCATESWTPPSTWRLRRCATAHTARISLQGRSVAGPRGSVCGEPTDLEVTPRILLQDAGASQSSISHSGSETGQNMVAHSQRHGILS